LKLYLAGRYGRRKELLGYANTLKEQGHTITSRWLNGEHEYADSNSTEEQERSWAKDDLDDIDSCDMLIAFTECGGKSASGASRGGRHVELGYALGMLKEVIVCGEAENIFCNTPITDALFKDFAALVESGYLQRHW